MAEPEVLREQLEWQQRMQQQEARFKAILQQNKAANHAELESHVQHIAEQLILPRCPAQSCRRFIPDFEACAGL